VWAINAIVQAHPNQLVALFSHGDVIRTTIAHYMGVPLDLFQRIIINTASISALAFHNARPMILFTNYTTELPKFEWKQDEKEQPSSADAAGENDQATSTTEPSGGHAHA
jgi:probable phosphoglycerate mutase